MNKIRMTFVLFAICAVLCAVPPAPAATNYVQAGDVLDLSWSSAAPTAGDPVVKGTATSSGVICGVALKTGTTSTIVPVAIRGVVDIPVRAIGSAIAIGDYVYSTVTNVNTCTASCTNVNTGVIFGKALEALVTASNTQTIKVLLINH